MTAAPPSNTLKLEIIAYQSCSESAAALSRQYLIKSHSASTTPIPFCSPCSGTFGCSSASCETGSLSISCSCVYLRSG